MVFIIAKSTLDTLFSSTFLNPADMIFVKTFMRPTFWGHKIYAIENLQENSSSNTWRSSVSPVPSLSSVQQLWQSQRQTPQKRFSPAQVLLYLSSAFPAVGSLWQLLATYGNFWQMLATNGNFWQMLATFGICNYCLCLCHLVNSVKGQFKRLVNIEILISFLTVENNNLTTFIVIH